MNSDTPTKAAIGLYFWLLLFEGALRKWLFPQWSDVLFVIRDPVVIAIYLFALRARLFPGRPAVMVLWVLATFSLAFALTGDSPFMVTLFGLRTNYLHLPLVFVMAQALDRRDVIHYGRWFILFSVPMLVLMMVQFNSEPDAWVNVGVGGTELGQLRGAMGRIRPPGTFSFISGVVSYFAFMMSFVIYGWVQRGTYSVPMKLIGSVMVLAALPVSISRSLALALLIVALFGAVVVARDVRRIPSYLGPAAAFAALALLAADTIYVEAFLTRWDEAVTAGGGGFYENVVSRIIDQFTQPFELAAGAPIFGHGIGLGTVAGARLSTGKYTFLLSESELARIVLELGPMLGFAFIGWRVWLAALLVVKSWGTFLKEGDSLAWLLAGATFLSVLIGQWGPATSLGFAVFGAGLTLAALNPPADETMDVSEKEQELAEDTPPT